MNITLADELRGIGIRRPAKGIRRRHFCVDEGSAKDVWREERLQKARARAKLYREKNADKVREAKRLSRQAHKEREVERKAEWRKANIDHVRAYQRRVMREWRKEHPDKLRASKRRWYERHKDEINAKRRARDAAKREMLVALKAVMA